MDGLDPNDIAARAGLDISAVKVADQSTLDELAQAGGVPGADVLRSESDVAIPTQQPSETEGAVVGGVVAEAMLHVEGSEEYQNGVNAQRIFTALSDGDIDSALNILLSITDERIMPLISVELKKGISKYIDDIIAKNGGTDIVATPVFESVRIKARTMPEELSTSTLEVIDTVEAAAIIKAVDLDLAMRFILCTRITDKQKRAVTMAEIAFEGMSETVVGRESRRDVIVPLLQGLGATNDDIELVRSRMMTSSGNSWNYSVSSVKVTLRDVLMRSKKL
jgi:hypothetical protein